MININEFNSALKSWHLEHNCSYPWRNTTDPYQILVAISMLQQAPAKRVAKDFFPKFITKFPDINSLAATKWSDVFPVWRGLGAYSKGKNLLRSAKEIVETHAGVFPESTEKLEKLPGVKPGVARAVLALAHDKPEALIDTTGENLISTLWPDAEIKSQARELINQTKSPTAWNNAFRDLCAEIKANREITGELGALINDKLKPIAKPEPQKKAPKQKKKSRKFRIEVGAACIYKDGKYLVQTRPPGKSFVGQWEFPGGKREKGENVEQCIEREIVEELGVKIKVGEHLCDILQEFERTELLLRFYLCDLISGHPVGKEGQELRWIEPKKFHGLSFLNTNAECIEKLQARHQ